MAIYTINDPDTKFAMKAMVACGGAWNPVRKVWMFGSIADAADAALELYRVTRATIPMLEELRSMLEDGTVVAAWEYDETHPLDVDALSFADAKAMLAAGRQVGDGNGSDMTGLPSWRQGHGPDHTGVAGEGLQFAGRWPGSWFGCLDWRATRALERLKQLPTA